MRRRRKRFEEHFWYFVNASSPASPSPLLGYTSIRSLENIIKGAETFALNFESWDQVVEGQYAIVGSPETVAEKLTENVERLGVGNLLGLFQLGTLGADDTRRNLRAVRRRGRSEAPARFPGTERRVIAGRAASAGGVSSQGDMSGAVA